jgi:hypothetical protein
MGTDQAYWQNQGPERIRNCAIEKYGKLNVAMSNKDEARFGRNGSRKVSLTGKHAGWDQDFETGEGDFMKPPAGRKTDDGTASDNFRFMFGKSGATNNENAKDGQSAKNGKASGDMDIMVNEKVKWTEKQAVGNFWDCGVPICDFDAGPDEVIDTKAAGYLHHTRGLPLGYLRHIAKIDSVRFHPKHQSSPDAMAFPALICPAMNKDGLVTGLQAIRIHEVGGQWVKLAKGDKISGGRLTGAAFKLPAGKTDVTDGTLVLVDGPEDALSINCAAEIAVRATLGAGNIGKQDIEIGRRIIVFDDAGGEGLKGAQQLAAVGHEVLITRAPEPFKDANDLFCSEGGPELVRQAIQEAAAVTPPPSKDVPAILLGGHFDRDVAETLEALNRHDPPILFQRGSNIVRIVQLDRDDVAQGITIPATTAQIIQLRPDDLRLWMARSATYEREVKAGSKTVDPPVGLARAILANYGGWPFRHLVALSSTPIIRTDGSIEVNPGYDARTGVFYNGSAGKLSIPETVGLEDAIAAKDRLFEIFGEFPFADGDLSRSVLLSYLLTLVIRPMIPLAPMLLITATTPGTGKGLLIRCCNLIVFGHDAVLLPALSGHQSSNEEEERKRITSMLLRGVQSAHFDNVSEKSIGSTALNALLTTDMWTDRVLGVSETPQLPARMMLVASGNNVAARGDQVRRTVRIHLDAGVEKPELRTFEISDLADYVRRNRSRLLSDLLTILIAYRKAGRPGADDKLLGSFEEWSREVAGPIRWLGLPDPTESQNALAGLDPETESLAAFLAAWSDMFGERELRLVDMLREIEPTQKPTGTYFGGADDDSPAQSTWEANEARKQALRDAIENAIGSTGTQSQKLGNWLRYRLDRVCNGYVLTSRTDGHSKTSRWCVKTM